MDYNASKNKLRGNKKRIYEEEPIEENSTGYNNYINKKQSPYKDQAQTQYQKFSYHAEGESALNIFKDTILQRGTRGILGMMKIIIIFSPSKISINI